MSYSGVPAGFGLNGKSIYTNVAKPMLVNMQFVVAATNGLGVTGLKSNGYVNNVFMHTSTTPASNNGFLNPNPAVGYAWIQLKNNFNYFLAGVHGLIATNSGSDVKVDNSAMTVGQVYVITTLGNTTAAQWLTLGVPVGVTPAVGVSFVALLVGIAGEANTSTSRVQLPVNSGISQIEVVGTTNTMVNSNVGSNAGQWVMIQFLKASVAGAFTGSALGSHTHDLKIIGGQASAGTDAVSAKTLTLGKEAATDITIAGANSATLGGVVAASAGTPAGSIANTVTYAVAAPTAGSIVCLQLWFDGSSVSIDGL